MPTNPSCLHHKAAPALAGDDVDDKLVTEAFAPGHRLPVPFQHGGVESINILDDCGILFLLGPHVLPVDWEVLN